MVVFWGLMRKGVLQLSMSIIGAWASLICLMLLRGNVISRLVFIATQIIL